MVVVIKSCFRKHLCVQASGQNTENGSWCLSELGLNVWGMTCTYSAPRRLFFPSSVRHSERSSCDSHLFVLSPWFPVIWCHLVWALPGAVCSTLTAREVKWVWSLALTRRAQRTLPLLPPRLPCIWKTSVPTLSISTFLHSQNQWLQFWQRACHVNGHAAVFPINYSLWTWSLQLKKKPIIFKWSRLNLYNNVDRKSELHKPYISSFSNV